MSTPDILRDLPEWLEPVSLVTDPTVLELRRAAISSICESEVSYEDIVAAAHGIFTNGSRDSIVNAIVEADSTFVGKDKDELIFTLSAGAAMALLADSDSAISVGLLVGSARVLNLEPRIPALPEAAAEVVLSASADVRRRIDPKDTPSLVKQYLRQADAADGTATDDATRDKAIGALARRFEEVVSALNARLAIMDEEIDALWWARSEMSSSKGERWTEMSSLRRVVAAAAESVEILSTQPPTAGFLRVVRNVAAVPQGRE